MPADRSILPLPRTHRPATTTDVLLTTTDYDALIHELEAIRSAYRSELAQRLRAARDFGGGADSDDLLAVHEDAAIDRARIAQLEELVRFASVLDESVRVDGRAGLGSTVRVRDEAGRVMEYELIGRRTHESRAHQISLASPIGKALLDTRPGDVVQAALPRGNERRLHVLKVGAGAATVERSSLADYAEAA